MSAPSLDAKSVLIGLLAGVCLVVAFGQSPAAPATAPAAPATAPAAAPPNAPAAHRYDISAVHVMNGTNLEQTVYILDHQTNNVYSRSKGSLHNLWGAPIVEFKVPD